MVDDDGMAVVVAELLPAEVCVVVGASPTTGISTVPADDDPTVPSPAAVPGPNAPSSSAESCSDP